MKKQETKNRNSPFQAYTNILNYIYITGFLILATTLFYFQVIKGDYFSNRAQKNYVRPMLIRAIRGSIFDRNGKTLAYDKAVFNISVIPRQIYKEKESLFKEISIFSNYDKKNIERNYKKNFENLYTPVDIITDIDKSLALKLKERFGDNIIVNPQPQRYYPYSYSSSHLLGYVKEARIFYDQLKQYGYNPLERVGFLGIEQFYDAYLRGEDGGDLLEVDAKGREVGFLGKRLPKKGKDLYLTIDADIQESAQKTFEDKTGVLILMACADGEIISLYSSPSYNPNNFITGGKTSVFLNDPKSPLLNRSIQSAYPPGSTFKPVLAIAGLEEKKITPYTPFFCNGEYTLGNARFRCLKSHHQQNLYQAIAHSCNVYFYHLALLLGPRSISKWSIRLGLDSYTNIDLPHEKKGFIPTLSWKKKFLKQNWYAGDTLNLSIGQGYMQTTPLGLARAINCIATGGVMVTPHLLKRADDLSPWIDTSKTLDIDKKNSNTIALAMRETVSSDSGTAHMLEDLNLGLAGKTGTAQTGKESHGWFIGFFPFEKPKYLICVVLEHGGSSHNAVILTHKFLEDIKQQGLLF
ncbi:MAG: penicillin-binding protein 2 [Candidatus Omnitrophica bacterium]|nr:penicillin-binding protein 2 [Candidatus Omnitrophota bacterium]